MTGRRKFLCFFASLLLCFLFSCGQGAPFYEDVPTNSTPIVSRIDPPQGAAGSQATIFGMGFSIVAPTNIITMGDRGASAENYAMLDAPTADEIESITFTVPDDLAAGDYPVVVVVHDTASNSDITFEVTP